MAEPPRLSQIRIPWGDSIIYFVTICVKGLRRVLANAAMFEAIQATVNELRKWRLRAGIVMPDHVHFVVRPTEERGLSVGDFAHGFKRLLRRRIQKQDWEWQRGCFDHLLRATDNAQQKWLYLEQNPVRAGLVRDATDWPYYLGFLGEEGKLTASPTDAREALLSR